MELDYKIIFVILGIIITFIGYYYYIVDIFKGVNKPHLYSYIIWCSVLSIGFAIQIFHNGGYGSLVSLLDALFCLCIAIISFKKGETNITIGDKLCLFLAFIAIVFWLVFNQPLISVILIILIDLFGFIPTFRKSFIKPFEESISVYLSSTLIFTFAIIGFNEHSFLTYGYPLAIIIFDITLVLMILFRRKYYLNSL